MAFFSLLALSLTACLAGAGAGRPPPPGAQEPGFPGSPPPSYQCGGDVRIAYPFWVDDDTTDTASYLGYPSLRLECRDDTPILRLPSGDYAVTRIRYGDRTVSLVDVAVFSDSDTCPHVAGRNLTLPPGSPPPFSLTRENTYLTFFLGCSFGMNDDHVVACLHDGRYESYVFLDDRVPDERLGLCHEIVGMPVLNTLHGIVPALKGGFDVRWTSPAGDDCAACEKAGGFCGQRREMEEVSSFSCFNTTPAATPPTRQPTTPAATPPTGQPNSGRALKIGMAVMAVIVLVTCFILFYYIHRRRQEEGSTGDVDSIYRLRRPSIEWRKMSV